MDVLFSSGRESTYMLNVVFSFNCYEVYMVTDDSRDVLVLSIDYIAYSVRNKTIQNRFQSHIKCRFDGIQVYGAQL